MSSATQLPSIEKAAIPALIMSQVSEHIIPSIILHPGREKSLLRRHPWIYSSAISEVRGSPLSGQTVDVYSANKDFIGRGAYSPASQIRARVWTWDEQEQIDEDFFRRRLERSIHSREGMPGPLRSNAVRLVYAESDGLPGLVLDRYDQLLVMQCLTAGVEYWRETLAELALELTGASGVYERSDVDIRKLEGLISRTGILRGEEPSETIQIREEAPQYGIQARFWVDPRRGHKTGFYLDQRDNRLVTGLLAKELEVLDCFSYTGGFTVYALLNKARSIVAVESSGEAIALAHKNIELNQLPTDNYEAIEGDVFHVLRSLRDSRRTFDMVILDPPRFAPTVSQIDRAARGYKDINRLSFKLIRPGGWLVTFSCSGGVSEELFQKIVASAALDAGVRAQVVQRLYQSADHPVALNFPEGQYLKGLVIRVDGYR
jgi:23S rRNA (cytosine1962-C5)-methyltransferase